MIKIGFTSYSFAAALSSGEMNISQAIHFAAGLDAQHMEICPGFFGGMNDEMIHTIVSASKECKAACARAFQNVKELLSEIK